MRQIPHLTVRGKPIAMVYEYRGVIHVEFALWAHKLKRGQTRQAVLDWAYEKYYSGNITIERCPQQPKTVLRENEAEAVRVAAMKRIRDKAEDDGLTLHKGNDLE